MSKARQGLVLAVTLAVTGCIIPRPLTTKVEVIRSADAAQVFGPQAVLRLGQEALVLRWDPSARSYVSQGPSGGLVTGLRVARLKGDVHLLQVELEGEEGYWLVPFRVSRTREVSPLACDVRRAAAEEFGVRMGEREAFGLDLAGERAGIIGLLAGVVDSCTPQFQVDTFVPTGGELATQAASVAGGSSGGCRPCPAGACIQGTVTDQTGASVPGATVRALRPGGGEAAGARSDENGHFLLTGLADGTVELRIVTPGFSDLKHGPIRVKGGVTYLFDEPFEIEIAHPPFETVAAPQEPRLCGGDARSRRR